MALKAEETKIITLDGVPRSVDSLSDQGRKLVTYYDDWKQREIEARSVLSMIQTAMQGLGSQIAAVAQADDEAAAAEAEATEGEGV